METGAITYYTRAENDYLFIKDNYLNGKVSDVMCYVMQNSLFTKQPECAIVESDEKP